MQCPKLSLYYIQYNIWWKHKIQILFYHIQCSDHYILCLYVVPTTIYCGQNRNKMEILFFSKNGTLAQWQSIRLLTEGLQVRVLYVPPLCGSTQVVEEGSLLNCQAVKAVRRFESFLSRQQYAEMAEWSKAPVFKTGDVKASVGSNPTLRAKEKNIINLLTFTNEYVILISSSEPNKNIPW